MATTMELGVDLEGLSNVEVTMDFTSFTNPKDFSKSLQEFFFNARDRDIIGDHTALVTNYPKNLFNIDDDKLPFVPIKRKVLYFHDSEILLLEMAGDLHEIATDKFHDLVVEKLTKMGCQEEIVGTGGMKMSFDGITKQPDRSWGFFGVGDEPIYATCVLECSEAESSRALSRDAKLWLEHENSQVTQVITLKIYRRPEIIFKVWTRGQLQRDTRAHHPLRAVYDQEIRITLQSGRPVVEGTMFLSFEKLMERKPEPGTREGNLNFSARELGGVARLIWLAMKFDIE